MGGNRVKLRRGWVGRHFLKLSAIAFFGYFFVAYYLFAVWRYQPSCGPVSDTTIEGELTDHYREYLQQVLSEGGFHFIYINGKLEKSRGFRKRRNGTLYVLDSPFLRDAYPEPDPYHFFLNLESKYAANILFWNKQDGSLADTANLVKQAMKEGAKLVPPPDDSMSLVEVDGQQVPRYLFDSCEVLRAAMIVPGTGLENSPDGFTRRERGR